MKEEYIAIPQARSAFVFGKNVPDPEAGEQILAIIAAVVNGRKDVHPLADFALDARALYYQQRRDAAAAKKGEAKTKADTTGKNEKEKEAYFALPKAKLAYLFGPGTPKDDAGAAIKAIIRALAMGGDTGNPEWDAVAQDARANEATERERRDAASRARWGGRATADSRKATADSRMGTAESKPATQTNKQTDRPTKPKQKKKENKNPNRPDEPTDTAPPAPNPQLSPLDAVEVGIGFGDSSIEGGEDTQSKPQSPFNPPPSAVAPHPKPNEESISKFFGSVSYSSIATPHPASPEEEKLADDAVRLLADKKPQKARETYLRFISRLGAAKFKTHLDAVLDEIAAGKKITNPGALLVSRLKMAAQVSEEGEATAPPAPDEDGNAHSADVPAFRGDLHTIPDGTVDRLHALRDPNDIADFARRHFGEKDERARETYLHFMLYMGPGNFKGELATFMSEEAAGERVNNPAAVFTQRCKDQIARIKAKKEAAKQTSAG